MPTCRSCGAEIRWVKIAGSGKAMPVDLEPLKVVVLRSEDVGWEVVTGYTSHFATCPDADWWRGKGGSRG